MLVQIATCVIKAAFKRKIIYYHLVHRVISIFSSVTTLLPSIIT